jgi:hypothetical protein
MLVPPERGTIIGRALWKVSFRRSYLQFESSDTSLQPRYVVLGSGAHLKTQNDIMSHPDTSARFAAARKGLKTTCSKPSLVDATQQEPSPDGHGLFISIYKAKVWAQLGILPVQGLIILGRLGVSSTISTVRLQVLRNPITSAPKTGTLVTYAHGRIQTRSSVRQATKAKIKQNKWTVTQRPLAKHSSVSNCSRGTI